MKKLLMICTLSLMILPDLASSEIIIDTGEPPAGSGYTLDYSNQWLSAEFTLNRAYTITDVLGWMYEVYAGEITIAIYNDGGDVPDSGSELYSQTFYADIPDGTLNAWIGVEDVSWHLGPGTYWAAFEVRTNGPYFSMQFPAPSPLDNYAYKPSDSQWLAMQDEGFGIRIYGVPAPAAILLCGLGAGLVGWLRRRRAL